MITVPVTDIFCDIDDFFKHYFQSQSIYLLPNPQRRRSKACRLSLSEIATIFLLFQMSHYRTFKHFYKECVLIDLLSYFPKAVSYSRFVEYLPSILMVLTAYALSKSGEQTGLYYIDSTTLAVCHNKRIYRHKVFSDIATRSKSSMGWFYGFKLHLAINHKGEVVSFCVTKGNVDDRKVVEQ